LDNITNDKENENETNSLDDDGCVDTVDDDEGGGGETGGAAQPKAVLS
jgi:hypothetical protein